MYHGLEVRTPLVDRCVVELAASLPLRQRYRHGVTGKVVGKYVMKKILAKIFPQEFIHRQKMGFGIPQRKWFFEGFSGRRLWDRVTMDERAPLYQWLDRRHVRSLLDQHGPNNDISNPLWLLLVLGLWLEQNPQISFS
jgi:asparagine synthase (glutamine-hydrolysing)